MAKQKKDFFQDGVNAYCNNEAAPAEPTTWQQRAFHEGWHSAAVAKMPRAGETVTVGGRTAVRTQENGVNKWRTAVPRSLVDFPSNMPTPVRVHIQNLDDQIVDEKDGARINRLDAKITKLYEKYAA